MKAKFHRAVEGKKKTHPNPTTSIKPHRLHNSLLQTEVCFYKSQEKKYSSSGVCDEKEDKQRHCVLWLGQRAIESDHRHAGWRFSCCRVWNFSLEVLSALGSHRDPTKLVHSASCQMRPPVCTRSNTHCAAGLLLVELHSLRAQCKFSHQSQNKRSQDI